MTVKQVIEDSALLCSLDREEAKVLLYAALNRALDEVGRAFPKAVEERIDHALPIPVYASCESVTVRGSAPLRIVCDGVASFCLQAYGVGRVSVTVDGVAAGEYQVTPDAPLTLAERVDELSKSGKGGRVILLLSTETALHLASVALYAYGYTEPIPYREYYHYASADFSKRFLAFTGRVTKDGRAYENARFDDDGIALPFGEAGRYFVAYYALPTLADPEREEATLDVRADAAVLVPLLTAYYAALEDENPAADAFLARYEAIKASLGKSDGETVGDVYGW